nr:transglycosylase SLT domain-containing protein [Desulfobulbaceae bacterium]
MKNTTLLQPVPLSMRRGAIKRLRSTIKAYWAPFIFILTLIIIPSFSAASESPFPTFKSIEPNVAFWKKVYAEYPSTMGMIHDIDNLSVIYEVITVKSSDISGSRRANEKQIKQVKDKYRRILNNLAAHQTPSTAEEKRVAELFGSKGSPQVWKNAADNIRFQLCISDRFKAGVIRSGQHLAEIKTIFRNSGLPVDLAYLPHVESSFNYNAYSKFGAAGIWQFIRSTGRRFLEITYTLDERRDPITSSHAAAKYLKENYKKLNSWPLALTAYNHGAGSMIRAKSQLGNYENIFNNYDNKRFGFASKNFYSEFLAAREIAQNYTTYFKDITLDQPVQVQKVLMTGYAPIDSLAEHFNVNIETIRKFNPALRNPVYSGQKYIPKGYSLKLPSGLKDFDLLAMNVPPDLYQNEQKHSRFYRVERGDTAGKIARLHNVTLKDLIDINMLNRQSTIYVGQNLRIPTPGEKIQIAVATLPEPATTVPKSPVTVTTPAQPALMPKPPEAPVVAEVPTPEPPPRLVLLEKTVPAPSSQDKTLTSQEIPEIRSFQDPAEIIVAELPAVEPLTSSVTEINPAVISGNFMVERVEEIKNQKVGFVQVEDTETLGHYAEWLEIPTQEIRELNGFRYGRQIRTHQLIKIPLGKVGKDLFEERRYEHHKEIEEDFFSAYKVVGIQAYSIKRGDNIWTLCQEELEIPFWLIKKYNPALNFESLMPKQQLTIPVIEKTS